MDTKTLSDFIAWSKTTDLQEIIYKKDASALHIKTAAANPRAADFSSKLAAVKSPAVGVYRSGKKGKEIIISENMPVKEGDILGAVIMNKAEKEVISPISGKLKIIGITDGQPAEYGQPLFFIEPE